MTFSCPAEHPGRGCRHETYNTNTYVWKYTCTLEATLLISDKVFYSTFTLILSQP